MGRAETIQHGSKFGIQRGAHCDFPPAQRQAQAVGMQKQPAQTVLFGHQPIKTGIAVFVIAGQWMPDMGGVNPNLMGASGIDPRLQQRSRPEQTDRLKPGSGRLAVLQDCLLYTSRCV